MKEEKCTSNKNSNLKELAKDIIVEHAVKALTGQEIDFADELEKEFVERDAKNVE